jgi:hypothetical protein
MDTVAGNERFVSDCSQKYSNFKVFGMNSGFVQTNIKDNLLGTDILTPIIETVLGWLTPTSEQHAEKLVPSILSPKLNDLNGVHLD